MKKVILFLTVLLTANFAYSQISNDGCGVVHYKNCDSKYLLESGFEESNGRTNEVKIQILSELRDRIEKRVVSLSNNSNKTCQKITNKMWLRTSKMNDSQVNGDVSRMQKFFKRIGIINWDGDGEFGSWDRAAVWKFQQQYMPEISPTGDVGVKTMAKINSMICTAIDDFSHNGSAVRVEWELGNVIGEQNYTKNALVKLILPDGSFKKTSLSVRADCESTNQVNTGKSTRPATAINSWLACESMHQFTTYYVVLENGKYLIKTRPEDASGRGIDTTVIIKEIN